MEYLLVIFLEFCYLLNKERIFFPIIFSLLILFNLVKLPHIFLISTTLINPSIYKITATFTVPFPSLEKR